MKFLAITILAASTGAAVAQPNYMRVTGLTDGEMLAVRSGPSAQSADLGDIPAGAGGIEVIDTDDSGVWGQIAWEDGNGWLEMAKLEADTVETIQGTDLPAGLQCSGTEPFWTLRYSQASAVYSDLGGRNIALTQTAAAVAEGRSAFPLALLHDTAGGRTLSVIQPLACSDGMSDRVYPYGITVQLQVEGGSHFLAGCCWLPLEVGSN